MSLLLSARSVAKSFSHRPLFTDLSLDLRAGEKIGLIGPNGAGKSTLLKILAGLEVPDAGERQVARSARIGYLPQEDLFPPNMTAREVILHALAGDKLEDHEAETHAAIALTKVGLDDSDKMPDTLSGGWRKRLAVARALALRPDFLLMDEPTNHLDLPGVVWLEKLLRASPFGYLAATHDRAFLRATAPEVIEISRVYPSGSFRADGGYDSFDEKRDLFLEAQGRMRDAVANQVRRETEWLGRKESAQRKKSRSRIGEAGERRAELAELNYRTAAAGAAGIDFDGTGRQTKKLLTAVGIGKSMGGQLLFENIDLIIQPGMRLGLLGANGSGKSTLLKVLGGELDPDTGTVTRAEGLRAVTFEQGRSSLDQTMRLRTALSPNADSVMYRGSSLHVAAWAQRFLFSPLQLDLELSALSGGEQARVRIAQLMLKPADLLLLDEPTNDLDIPALEVLEESLAEFPGAIILVSHDRDLMDRLCTEVIGLDGRGNAKPYGSVGQWLSAYDKSNSAAKVDDRGRGKLETKTKLKKLSYKEQQEWEGLEAALLAAEADAAAKGALVEAASTAPPPVLTAACAQLTQAQRKVEVLYARWEVLEAKRSGG